METAGNAPNNQENGDLKTTYVGTAALGCPAEQSSAASPRQPGSLAPAVSVIVPARNEEVCLGACLESLAAQTGVSHEIIVVDDHSTDRTREIATSFPGVRVVEAGPLPEGWTGKNNAVTAGARHACGDWLLFTDADTVHLPGWRAGAVQPSEETGGEMLAC